MGGAPSVETVRPGVQLVHDAANSFRRLEHRLGRPIDVNSTYRDYNVQLGMYNAWMRYVNSGYRPAFKPNHSRALHPDYSKHCQGLALDSDDWTTPGFIDLAAEYGWIRTADNDPTEQHHFEYQWWNDRHRNDPLPEEDDMYGEDDRKRDIDTNNRMRRIEQIIGGTVDGPNVFEYLRQTNSASQRITIVLGGSVKDGQVVGGNVINRLREVQANTKPAAPSAE